MKLNYSTGLMLVGVLGAFAWADGTAPASGEFYVNPGIALTGAGANSNKNSFSLDAGYLKSFHQIASAGWEAGYLFGSKFEGDGFTSDTSRKILHISPEIKLGPTFAVGGYQVNPFVIGGGGLYWSHQNSGTVTVAGGAMAPIDSVNNVNGGWNIGAGAALSLPGNWSVGIDVRRHEIVNKSSTDFTWITPAIRFALLFS
jgi:Outer membrane protein beta-barrel domain